MKSKFLTSSFLTLLLSGFSLITFCQPKLSTAPETIINGKLWIPSYSISAGQQLFLKDLELNGSLQFRGQQFKNIKFFYDISREEIITSIISESNTMCNIVLNPDFLEGFTVIKNQQIYNFLRGDFIHEDLTPTNYYQFFKSASITYIIKHKSLRVLNSTSGSRKFNYIDNTKLYAIKNNELSSISNKMDLLSYFPQMKKEMKQYLRSNKLRISNLTPFDAIQLLLKFDQ